MDRFRQLLCLPALALLLSSPLAAQDGAADPAPDFRVETDQYVGLWYEIARTPNSFQDNRPARAGKRYSECFNVTAEYAPLPDGRLQVLNTCVRETDKGEQRSQTAKGFAEPIEGSQGRQYQVAFGPGIARFFQRAFGSQEGNYWIYCLGPVEIGRYTWAVVSDGDKDFTYFLAREPSVGDDVMNAMLSCTQRYGLPTGDLKYTQRTP